MATFRKKAALALVTSLATLGLLGPTLASAESLSLGFRAGHGIGYLSGHLGSRGPGFGSHHGHHGYHRHGPHCGHGYSSHKRYYGHAPLSHYRHHYGSGYYCGHCHQRFHDIGSFRHHVIVVHHAHWDDVFASLVFHPGHRLYVYGTFH